MTALALAALAALAILVWPRRRAQAEPAARGGLRQPGRGSSGLSRSAAGLSRSAAGSGCAPFGALPSGRLAQRVQRLVGRGPGHALDDVADLAEVLCAPLRAGLTPAAAVTVAGEALGQDHALAPLLRELALADRSGESLAAVWDAHARDAGLRELRLLGCAWSLSEQLGSPLADALATVAEVLRAKQSAKLRLGAVTAAPRATMALLALLPLAGPGVGALFGMSPAELYADSPAAAATMAVGCLLTLVGWRWSRSLLRRALRPETVR